MTQTHMADYSSDFSSDSRDTSYAEARQETKPTAEDIAKKDADVSQLGGLSIRRIRLAKK
jgi:hypothetical protein